jgi:hypothetical protein
MTGTKKKHRIHGHPRFDMNATTRIRLKLLGFTVVLSAVLAVVPWAPASVNGPYLPDANTVILLHLDEAASSGIASNAVTGGAGFIATANPSAASPRNPTPGILGATGASGAGYSFGNCANLTYSNSVGL